MSNAIQLGEYRPNTTCPICYDDFNPEEEQWTHEGGERHVPFHKKCLKTWVEKKTICPFDETVINLNSLLSRTERIFKMAKQQVANSALTTIGTSAIVAGIAGFPFAAAELGIIGLSGAAIAGTVAGSITGAIAELVGAGPTIALAGTIGTGIGVGLGTLRIVGELVDKAVSATAVRIEAATPRFILEALEEGNREILQGSILGLSIFTAGLITDSITVDTMLSTIPAVSLISGIAAGIATWWRRR